MDDRQSAQSKPNQMRTEGSENDGDLRLQSLRQIDRLQESTLPECLPYTPHPTRPPDDLRGSQVPRET